MNTPNAVKPWYREPWPWILMAGPAIVIVAGIVTAWLAVSTSDGLVTDDYYRKGLQVNKTIAASEQATKLGLAVALRVSEAGFVLKLTAADKSFAAPSALVVTLSHPTRAGVDQTQVFARSGDTYTGMLRLPSSGHWLVLIEDEPKSWRLMGKVVLPSSGETLIGGVEPAGVRS